jgi:GT2 family glycosyltransferase
MPQTISVIIPAYNAGGTIGHCLEGVLKQGCRVSEVIVVDDGSTDNTAKIAEKYKCRVVRSNRNLGVAGARNIGLKEAMSDYLYFIDSDCVPFEDCIEKLMNVFLTSNKIGIVGGRCITPDDRNLVSLAYDVAERHKDLSNPKGKYAPYLSGSNLCIKRKVAREVGLFNERLLSHEDFDYSFRANEKGFKVFFHPKATTLHYNHRRTVQSYINHVFNGGVYGTIFRLKYKPKLPLSRFYPNSPLIFSLIAPAFILYSILRILKNNVGIRPIRDILLTFPIILLGQAAWGLGCVIGAWKFKKKGHTYG